MTVIDLCSVVAKKVATKVYCDSIIGIELSPYTAQCQSTSHIQQFTTR